MRRLLRLVAALLVLPVVVLWVPTHGDGQVTRADHGLPHATVKVWNITDAIGFNPDESVEDITGITQHVATPDKPQTIAATIENTTHPEGPCGLIFWNPATNAFKWYGVTGGFSAGIDLNLRAPVLRGPESSLFGAATFQPGDVWVTVNGGGYSSLYVNFKGSNNFRHYPASGVNGVQVDQATGMVYFTDLFSGTINQLNPATNAVTTWVVGGSPHYLAIHSEGPADNLKTTVYSAVAQATVAGGADAIVRIDPAASADNVTSWAIPGGGLTPGLSFQTPDGVAFDEAGSLWFTESASNQIGRLNPSTGEICEFTKAGLSNPQLIASTGFGVALQTFFTEGQGNAVGVLTQETAVPITDPCPEVTPLVSTVASSGFTIIFSDSIRTPREATITPSEFDIPGLDGEGGILRFPMPTPADGNPAAPNFPSGMTGVVFQKSVFGSYLDIDFAGNSAVFQLTSAVIVAPPPVVAPPFATSYYIQTTKSAKLFELGRSLGEDRAQLPGVQDDIVILMFGHPKFQGGEYGTLVYAVGFVSNSVIAKLVEEFAAGYYKGVEGDPDSHLRIVIGTSNCKLSKPCPKTEEVTFEHGRAWGQMVNEVALSIIGKRYASQVDVAGGSDMELDWNSPTATKDWLNGYASVGMRYFYNFGDAAGCPPPTGSSCNNGWTQEDIRYISWKSPPAWPLPQIYNTGGAQAKDWQQITLYSALLPNEARMVIAGSLTERQACQQVKSGCQGIDNMPEEGWTQLQDELNSDPRTAQVLRWSTDIKWSGK